MGALASACERGDPDMLRSSGSTNFKTKIKFLSQMCAVFVVRLKLSVATLARNWNSWLDVSGNSSTEVGYAISAYDCVAEV